MRAKKTVVFLVAVLVISTITGSVPAGSANLYQASDPFNTATLILGSSTKDFDRKGATKFLEIGHHLYALAYSDRNHAKSAYHSYQTMREIEFVEPDVIVGTTSEEQSAGGKHEPEILTETEENVSDEQETEITETEITETAGTETEVSNAPVTVAVIDTGIDAKIASIAPYLMSMEEDVTDQNGHGTAIAGLLVDFFCDEGVNQNQVQILPIKVAGEDGKCTILQLYLGMELAMEKGADILNISMGTANIAGSKLLETAVQEAYAKNVIVVTSAGNNSEDVNGYAPANLDTAVTVGSVNIQKEKSAFSNYGKTIDCVSYGENITVTGLDGRTETVKGTSYSAALVTAELAGKLVDGVIGTPEDAENYIKNTAEDLGAIGWDENYGYGLMSAYTYQTEEGSEIGNATTERETETETEITPEVETETETASTEESGLSSSQCSAPAGKYADSGTLTAAEAKEMESCLAFGDIMNDINTIATSQDVYAASYLVSIAKTKAAELKNDIASGTVTARYFDNSGFVSYVGYRTTGNEAVDAEGVKLEAALNQYGRTGNRSDQKAFFEKLDSFYNILNANRDLTVQADSMELTDLASIAAVSASRQVNEQSENKVTVQSCAVSFSNTEAVNEWQNVESENLYETMNSYNTEHLKQFVTSLSVSDQQLLAARLGQHYQDIMTRVNDAEVQTESADNKTVYVADEAQLRMYNCADQIGDEDGMVAVNSTSQSILASSYNLTTTVWISNYMLANSDVTITSSQTNSTGVMAISERFNGDDHSMLYTNGHTITVKGTAILDGYSSKVSHNGFLVCVGAGGTLNIQGSAVLQQNCFSTWAGAKNGGYGSAVHNEGTVNMSGGTIQLNTFGSTTLAVNTKSAYEGCGGAGIGSSGTLNITDGKIRDNYGSWGGGIWVTAGTATIDGAMIYHNHGIHAGNIAVSNPFGGTATLDLKGTSTDPNIIANSYTGNGIFIDGKCTANITTGQNYIYGNASDGIKNEGTLNITAGAKIGFADYTSISVYTSKQNESSGISNAGTLNISGAIRDFGGDAPALENSGTCIVSAGVDAVLLCTSADRVCNNTGYMNAAGHAADGSRSIVMFSSASTYGIVNKGLLVYGGDIDGSYNVTENGRTAASASQYSFTYCIYSNGTGMIDAVNYPFALYTDGCPVIQNGATGIKVADGSAYIANSNICNNTGDGISISAGASVTVAKSNVYSNAANGINNAGALSVTGTTATISGNKRGVLNSGYMTFSGGTISGNASSASGAGIYNRGTVNMTDGIISGNRADTYGGGVMNKAGATFYLNGGTINGNACDFNQSDATTGTGGGIHNEAASTDASTGVTTPAGIVWLNQGWIYGNSSYGNVAYGVYNKGTCYLASQSTPVSAQAVYMGVSSITSYTDYVGSANTTGNIFNGTSGTLQLGGNNTNYAYARLISYQNININNEGTITCPGNTTDGFGQFVVLWGSGTGINNSGTATIGAGVAISNFNTAEDRVGVNNSGTFNLIGGYINKGTTGINNTGTVTMSGGAIEDNTVHGVYQNGIFNMVGSAVVNTNNDVCLAYGKVITVNGALSTNGTVASITPTTSKTINDEISDIITKKGTIVVQTSYEDGKASDALFYKDANGNTQYHFSLSNRGILRPGDYMDKTVVASEKTKGNIANDITDTDIAISTSYNVTYGKYYINESGNTVKDSSGNDIALKSLPDDKTKFWCEDLPIELSQPAIDNPDYSGYSFLGYNDKTTDSTTMFVEPYTYKDNAEMTIYAHWMSAAMPVIMGNSYAAENNPLGVDFEESGSDTVDIGTNGKGTLLSSSYTLYDNQDTDEEEHFSMDGTRTYTDEATGEDMEQTITATAVGYSFNKKMTATNKDVFKIETTYSHLQELIDDGKSSSVPDAITTGNPNSDFDVLDYKTISTASQTLQSVLSPMVSSAFKGSLLTSLYAVNNVKAAAPNPISDSNMVYANLYTIYDYGPTINANSLYYSLADAQGDESGTKITLEELLSHAVVADAEDTNVVAADTIPDEAERAANTTYFTVMDYAPTDFTGFTHDGAVTVTYEAIDSAGNITRQRINVNLVDTAGQEVKDHRNDVRFISKKYLNTLDADSIWNTNSEYQDELIKVLDNERINMEETKPAPIFGDLFKTTIPASGEWATTPQQTWQFTHEQVISIQDYVDTHGLGNYSESNGLSNFLTEYADCKVQ